MNQLALTMPEAREFRDEGMRLSADHAESIEPGWSESAYRVLTDYARGRASFTSEDYRDHLAGIGFPVPVPKALGGVFQKAAKRGVIRRIGFGISRERHLSPCPLWSGVAA